MDKWEYKILKVRTNTTDYNESFDENELNAKINNLGNDGWEVISTVPIAGSACTMNLCVFLKRKLK
jgi:hypothetical protein